MSRPKLPIKAERIENAIIFIRGRKVMLDSDLAAIYNYNVETRVLNQAVKRNKDRFPEDFIFQLTPDEIENLKSQNVISSFGHGGKRKRPFVFTEHGAVMLASVLRSEVAVKASVQVVRAFIKLREMVSKQDKLLQKIEFMERKYDKQFAVVFQAIKHLMQFPEEKHRVIGFKKNG